MPTLTLLLVRCGCTLSALQPASVLCRVSIVQSLSDVPRHTYCALIFFSKDCGRAAALPALRPSNTSYAAECSFGSHLCVRTVSNGGSASADSQATAVSGPAPKPKPKPSPTWVPTPTPKPTYVPVPTYVKKSPPPPRCAVVQPVALT